MGRKRYKLRYLPLFEDDLNEIVDYIQFHLVNSDAAERLISAVHHAILTRLNNEVRRIMYQRRKLNDYI